MITRKILSTIRSLENLNPNQILRSPKFKNLLLETETLSSFDFYLYKNNIKKALSKTWEIIPFLNFKTFNKKEFQDFFKTISLYVSHKNEIFKLKGHNEKYFYGAWSRILEDTEKLVKEYFSQNKIKISKPMIKFFTHHIFLLIK